MRAALTAGLPRVGAIVAIALASLWLAAWAGLLAADGFGPAMVRALQILGTATAVGAAVAYLLVGPRRRRALVAAPVLMLLPSLLVPLLPAAGLEPLADLLVWVNIRFTAFLIFPAAAMALGLIGGIGLDLVIGGVRLFLRPDGHR